MTDQHPSSHSRKGDEFAKMVVPDSSDVEKESPMVLCKLERLGVPQPLIKLIRKLCASSSMPHTLETFGLKAFLKILLDPSQDFTGRLTIALDGRPEIKTVSGPKNNQMVGEDIMRYMGQLQNGQN
jgi:hypothetical protein